MIDHGKFADEVFVAVSKYIETREMPLLARIKALEERKPIDGRDGKDFDPELITLRVAETLPGMVDRAQAMLEERLQVAVKALPIPKDGRDGSDGARGEKGEPGESIKGDKGDPGESIKGDKGDPGESVKGDRGDKGDLGDKGEVGESIRGEKGDRGASVHVGSGPPSFEGAAGDCYIDTKSGNFYHWT